MSRMSWTSSVTSRVRSALDDLQSEKVTVRKKAHDELRALLDNEQVLSMLSPNDTEAGTDWAATFFQAASGYVEREAVKLEKDVMAGRNCGNLGILAGTHMEILLKIFRAIRKGGSHLATGMIVPYLLRILDKQCNPFFREHYSQHAIKLLREIMADEYHLTHFEESHCEVNNRSRRPWPGHWRRLLELSFDLLTHTPKDLPFFSLCEFLAEVWEKSNEHSAVTLPFLKEPKRFNQLKDTLLSFRLKAVPKEQRLMFLQCVNIMTDIVGLDCRNELCSFGEACLIHVLDLYEISGSPAHQEVVIHFLQMQMTLHHPCGARTEDEGACFHDKDKWRLHLYRIYENLVENVVHHLNRKCRSDVMPELSKTHLRLATEVCFQLVSDESDAGGTELNVTQYVPEDQTQSNRAPKRRRIERLHWSSLLCRVAGNNGKEDRETQRRLVPWLQIVCSILEIYPKFVGDSQPRIVATFSCLNEVLQDCKLMAVRCFLFHGFRLILRASGTNRHSIDWQQILASAINVALSNNCVVETYDLVTSLVEAGCVRQLDELFGLFVGRSARCHDHSLRLLICLMSVAPVPRDLRHITSMAFRPSPGISDHRSKFTTRRCLLDWFCGPGADDIDSEVEWNNFTTVHPDVVSAFLWGLILKNPCKAMYNTLKSVLRKDGQASKEPLEVVFMEQSLFRFPRENDTDDSRRRSFAEGSGHMTSTELADDIQDKLVSLCGRGLQIINKKRLAPDMMTQSLQTSCRVIGVLVTFFKWSTLMHINLTMNRRLKEATTHLMKSFFKAVSTILSDRTVQAATRSTVVLRAIETISTCNEQDAETLLNICEQFWLPEEIVESLFKTLRASMDDLLSQTVTKNVNDKKMATFPRDDFFDMDDEEESETTDADFADPEMEQSQDKWYEVEQGLTFITLVLFPPEKFAHVHEESVLQGRFLKSLLEALGKAENQECVYPRVMSIVLRVIRLIMKRERVSRQTIESCLDITISFPKTSASVMTSCSFNPRCVAEVLRVLHEICITAQPRSLLDGLEKRIVVYIKSFITIHQQSNFERMSTKVQVLMVRLLSSVAGMDLDGNLAWTETTHYKSAYGERLPSLVSLPNDSEEEVPPVYTLLRFLCHHSFEIRRETAIRISEFFRQSTKSPHAKRTCFRELRSHLEHLCKENKVTESTKVSTILLTLTLTAKKCALLLLESVSGMILFQTRVAIDYYPLLRRAVVMLAGGTKQHLEAHRALEELMKSVLGYVVNEYMKQNGYKLEDFPYQLLECSSETEFLTKHTDIVLPLALWRLDGPREVVRETAALLKVTEKELLIENFAQVTAFVLPFLAAEEMGKLKDCLMSQAEKAHSKALRVNQALDDVLGVTRGHRLLNERIPEVIAQVFQRLHDPNAVNKTFDIDKAFATPNPPYFTEQMALNLLDFFSDVASPIEMKRKRQSLFVYLVDSLTDFLQRLLQGHCASLRDGQAAEDTHLIILHGLSLFVGRIIREREGLAAHIPFVTWFLSHSVILCVQSSAFATVRKACTCILKSVISLALESHVNQVDLCHSLMPAWNEMLRLANSRENYAIDFLRFVKDQYGPYHPNDLLIQAIRLDDTTPVDITLSETPVTLNDVIEYFLDVKKYVGRSHLEAGLQLLLRSLQEKSGELNEIRSAMEVSLKLSEDATKNRLYTLIIELMDLVSTKDRLQDISHLASECLGEISPTDIGSLLLTTVQPVRADIKMPFSTYVVGIVQRLLDLQTSACSDTVQAASQALKHVFQTPPAAQLTKEQLGSLHYNLLAPFRSDERCSVSDFGICQEQFHNLIDDERLWSSSETNYESWIRQLVTSLLTTLHNGNPYKYLLKVCRLDAGFADFMLPLLIHDLLRSKEGFVAAIISRRIRGYFEKHFKANSRSTDVSAIDFRCHRSMLGVIDHLRHQKRGNASLAWEQNFWIHNLNYLHVSKAALACSAYFSAILYADLWCQKKREDRQFRNVDDSLCDPSSQNILSTLYVKHADDVRECQAILYQAYRKTGELDSLYGCGRNFLMNTPVRFKQLLEEGQNFRAMALVDVEANLFSSEDMVEAMFNAGLLNTLASYGKTGPSREPSRLESFQFECAWRLAQWDNLEDGSNPENTNSFAKARSLAIEAVLKNDCDRYSRFINLARGAVCGDLETENVESSRAVLYALSCLGALQDLGRVAGQVVAQTGNETPLVEVDVSDHSKNRFALCEPTLLQRIVILENFGRDKKRPVAELDACTLSLKYIWECMKHGKLQLAWNRLTTLKKHLPGVASSTMAHSVRFQESNLLWQSNERVTAMFVMEGLCHELSSELGQDSKSLYAEVLQTLGKWSWDLRSHSANVILEQFFLKAIRAFDGIDGEGTLSKKVDAYVDMANFCDAQYKDRVNYLTSKECEDKQKLLRQIKKDAKKIKTINASSKDIRTGLTIMERHASIDDKEIAVSMEEKRKYLLLALEHYGKALSIHNKHDLVISRFISLWFANAQDDRINDCVDKLLSKIDSCKFVTLLYQLAARLKVPNGSSSFQTLLWRVVERCGHDHVFHTVPVLLPLIHGSIDETFTTCNSPTPKVMMDDRGKAAKAILSKVQSRSKATAKLVKNFTDMSLALIRFAYYVANQKAGRSSIPIDPQQEIVRLKNVQDVPVLTIPLEVRADRDYSAAVVGLAGYDHSFESVGGITAPKKIRCRGTDGKMRTQLIKGKDDLRQDAVMQQVFGLMNMLLRKNKATRTKRLGIRQYKVVPLAQRSGVLEWCEGTMPLSLYLTGPDSNSGAHVRYRPEDTSPSTCKHDLMQMQKKAANREELTKSFLELCKRLRPVMRYFFYENFISAGQHFERRLAYTRSAAATSMVGYVLGLGDRHMQNILIDKRTAELVHIDLGVAFEQGKILPTPETIPFRLTRDIVDGFGPSGVEGTFRRCCYDTMQVLHESKNEILTILEVLTRDPLYNWSLTPEKAYRIQHGRDADSATRRRWVQEDAVRVAPANPSVEEESGNKMAERVMLRVSQKLNGMEDGQLMSVDGQVNTLIQQACDPSNLCAVFVGWQPYL